MNYGDKMSYPATDFYTLCQDLIRGIYFDTHSDSLIKHVNIQNQISLPLLLRYNDYLKR